MLKIIIAAVARNGVIGRSTGEMPWHSKEEFQHFRNTTIGFPVIMGRKTFESLGGPLKGRINIILTRKMKFTSYNEEQIKILSSLDETFDYCEKNNYEKIFIIGGGQIFPEAIKSADEMIISFMKFNAEGDVYFPEISSKVWKEKSREDRSEFEIVRYVKIDA
ncbi:MAG TPA: dihydrofolate reductase [Ignavibacteriaceae bacterium]|nr:dihydrofolate reductase [Ignavibacteriaceae bacterium]